MSRRYRGGFITANALSGVSGEWTLDQQLQAQAAGTWPGPPTTYTYTTTGVSTLTLPAWATSVQFKVWGSGGEGNTQQATGGYVGGIFSVTGGEVLTIFVGTTGLGSGVGAAGYGATRGGEYSYVKNSANTKIAVAGGGGGQGQTAYGGGGGGNGSGRNGTGNVPGLGGTQSAGGAGGVGAYGTAPSGVSWSNGAVTQSGGAGGGSGSNVDNRGGGGGAGYFGGGGGSSNDADGSGGGGGSGYVTGATSVVSIQGSNGNYSPEPTAPNNTDPNYVTNRGRGNNNGLVVLIVS